MPYQWSPDTQTAQKLTLWPYQSLQPQGFVWFIGATSLMLLLPLVSVMGTVVLWGLLPFIALAVAGVWFAIHRNRRSARIVEVLTLTEQQVHLVRHNPNGDEQEWACNRYWAHPTLHPQNGPVPNYVTLKGGGREVEIGAFLSEEERISLYDDLRRELRGS